MQILMADHKRTHELTGGYICYVIVFKLTEDNARDNIITYLGFRESYVTDI